MYNFSLLLLNGSLEIYQIILSLSVKTKIISKIPVAILFASYIKKRRGWRLFKDFMAHQNPWEFRSPGWAGGLKEALLNSEQGHVIPHHPGPAVNGLQLSSNLAAIVQIQSSQREDLAPLVSKRQALPPPATLFQKTAHGGRLTKRKMKCY